MKFVLIIHEVEDYSLWKVMFDNASGIRKQAGELSYQLMKFESHSNKIVHLSVWTSHKQAKDFFESSLLMKIRKDAGVKQPEFMYLEQLESAIL